MYVVLGVKKDGEEYYLQRKVLLYQLTSFILFICYQNREIPLLKFVKNSLIPLPVS